MAETSFDAVAGSLNSKSMVPDYANAINIKPSTNQAVAYTAPSNGYIAVDIRMNMNTAGYYLNIRSNDVSLLQFYIHATNYGASKTNYQNIIPIAEGNEFTFHSENYSSNLVINTLKFIPSK